MAGSDGNGLVGAGVKLLFFAERVSVFVSFLREQGGERREFWVPLELVLLSQLIAERRG